MTKRRRKSEPTGLELFLYWWAEHSGHEEAPQKHFQLPLYDEEYRSWLSGVRNVRETFLNVCRQLNRRTVGSLMTPYAQVLEIDGGGLVLTPEGRALVSRWLDRQPPVERGTPSTKATSPQDAPHIPTPPKEHPIGTQEMVAVVAENYRRGKPVGSYTEGFRDGAEWVLNMDAATLRYLRGELNNG